MYERSTNTIQLLYKSNTDEVQVAILVKLIVNSEAINEDNSIVEKST